MKLVLNTKIKAFDNSIPINWIDAIYINMAKLCRIALGSCESYIRFYNFDLNNDMVNKINVKEDGKITTLNKIIMTGQFMNVNQGQNPLFLAGNNEGEFLIYTYDFQENV